VLGLENQRMGRAPVVHVMGPVTRKT
jgi:hypothetical protein